MVRTQRMHWTQYSMTGGVHRAALSQLRLRAAVTMLVWVAVLATGLVTPALADAPEKPGSNAAHPPQGKHDQPGLAHEGYRLLLNKPYVKAAFDHALFDQLHLSWEEPLAEEAANATPEERRRLAFDRYGFTPAPGRKGPLPLQFTDNGKGGWSINCFSCHGGKVAGKVIPGAPNSLFAMQTLAEDVRTTRRKLGEFSLRDLAAGIFPQGDNVGTTNAVMFGVLLEATRNNDLELVYDRPLPDMVHHDMDTPAWWLMKKKKALYADGFAERDHRALMQFLMTPENSGKRIRGWENDFKEIYEWILSLEPPRYPFPIDHELAGRGKRIFNRNCAECHGTYGQQWTYPNRIVPIDEVGTDPVRLQALTPEHRRRYQANWFSNYGKKRVLVDPGGYVAPPLDGIWASAPYFHNGSVPTLWHVLHSSERPNVWRRSIDGYDTEKVGLEIETFDEVPSEAKTKAQKRWYFNTRGRGKSAAGHTFPDSLDEEEKTAVLEYLKTL